MSSNRPEHVRPDRFALVTAGERRDENLGAHGYAEMIRPERDEPFDERPIGRHALRERGAAFGRRNADERAPRLLAGLPPLLGSSACPDRAERANRIGNRTRRAFGRRAQQRRVALQLCPKPAARVADALALAGACAEPEPVEGAKRGIHEFDLDPLDDDQAPDATRVTNFSHFRPVFAELDTRGIYS